VDVPFLRWIASVDDHAPRWAKPAGWVTANGVDDLILRAAETEVHEDDPAMIVLTSGQSASPKGVLHTHGAIVSKVHYLRGMLSYDATSDLVASMPFFWVGGLVMTLLTGMEIGARVVCADASTYRAANPIGASVGDKDARAALIDAGYVNNPALGMTETFGMYSWGLEPFVEAYPLATPLDYFEPGYAVEVLDSDGKPVADGESGEIAVRGPTVTRQLIKVARAEAFTEDGFYRTGDRGLRNGQRIHFLGRLGDMIKTSGANVAPQEVERELLGLVGVAAAYVAGLADEARGEIVAAAVVPETGAILDPEEVRAQLRERLSAYKVPRRIVILGREDVPLTPSQKIDRRALRALLADP
jgi:acyl-CoA synthetase (AMP-forming)/AMP-acid ligase II